MWLNKFDSHLSKSLHRASWIQGGLKIASFLSAGFYFKRLDIRPATLALLFWCLHEPRSWRPCHACCLADSSHQLQNIPTSDTAEDEKQHRSSEEILKYSSPIGTDVTAQIFPFLYLFFFFFCSLLQHFPHIAWHIFFGHSHAHQRIYVYSMCAYDIFLLFFKTIIHVLMTGLLLTNTFHTHGCYICQIWWNYCC